MTTAIAGVIAAVIGFILALVSLGSGNPTTGTAPEWAFYTFIGSIASVIGGIVAVLVAAGRMTGWLN